jgi:putative ATPase
MPECKYALFHCATVLAKTKKSRVIASAMAKAESAAIDYPDLAVPLEVRNAPTRLMTELGYNKGYKWQAGFKPARGFLPSEISQLNLFDDTI